MKYENTRKIVLDAILDAVDMGLIHGTSGNIAMRDDKEDVVAITPSGISYKAPTGDIVNCEHDAIGNMAVAFVGTSGVQMGWLASQADMLAEDWMIL